VERIGSVFTIDKLSTNTFQEIRDLIGPQGNPE